jgi:hypothetical protein
MIPTLTARRSASTRPALLTPAFLAVTLASLAYFTADGILIPAAPPAEPTAAGRASECRGRRPAGGPTGRRPSGNILPVCSAC